MPPANVEAIAFVLDISPSSADLLDDGNSFFTSAVSCIGRVVERKIFSRPNDLVSLLLLGSEESNNGMYQKGETAYKHISVATTLSQPSWDLIELLNNKVKLSKSQGDWVDSLIVAADYLVSSVQESGLKVSSKKIVLLTDFKARTTIELDQLQGIIDGFKTGGMDLIVIGSSILEDDESDTPLSIVPTDTQQYNLKILDQIMEELDGDKRTFEEAYGELKYHKKKAVNLRPWNVDLSIGSEIKIPITAYGRIRNEPPVKISWSKVTTQSVSYESLEKQNNLIAVETKRWFSKADGDMDVIDKDSIIGGYSYGDKTIPFTELEQSMNYQSGERGLICYGFTKSENINCSHLTDNGVTFVVGRAGNQPATVALEALVLALKENDLVLIARKVHNKGNAPRMVALFPIIKKNAKYLSMIALAFREDHRHMLLPGLNKKKYQPTDEQLDAMDKLIEAMDLGEGKREVFSIKANVNPTLQYTYDSLAYRAMNPGKPLAGPRPEVQKLIQIPSSVAKLSVEPLEKVKALFPIVAIEKTSGRKKWIDEHLSAEDRKDDIQKLPDANDIAAASVLVNSVKKIGTVNPADDFKILSLTDFLRACDEVKEVIESLVTLSFSEDYSKPILTLSEMRKSCLSDDPSIYNDWLIKFKEVLLDKFKSNFLKEMFEKKLGLITDSENIKSTIGDDFARKFEDFTITESISKPEIDDVSDLFD